MSSERIFVGRKDELSQFDEVLASPKGRAIVVVGQAGMGKTLLVNKMAHRAAQRSDLKCGFVRYEVTDNDDPGTIMTLMIDDARVAAKAGMKTIEGTKEQWRALYKAAGVLVDAAAPGVGKAVEAVGDLLISMPVDQAKPLRTQLVERLRFISEKMRDNARAIFIVDPEKTMQPNSQDDWRLVVRELPDKIIFLFAQRPEDVLISSPDFMALENVTRLPGERLDPLDEGNVDELIEARKTELPIDTIEARRAVERYEGHPYAVSAALDLIIDGRAIEDLPSDPTPERIAETQWNQVCDKHDKAVNLLEAYAVLEVPVPGEVVEFVAGPVSSVPKILMSNPYLRGLLREEPERRRIYHVLLADHVRSQVSGGEGERYHRRAVEVYRKRLTADTKPDALAAQQLPGHVLAAEGPQAFVTSFINDCTPPLNNLGLLDTFISLSNRALNEFVSPGTTEEAALLGNLGLIYRKRGDLDQAEAMHKKALAINEKLGHLEGMAREYGNLGLIYKTRGDLDQAEALLKKSLAIEEKLGCLEGMAANYGNLANVYLTRGDLDQAEAMHKKSLAIEEKLDRLGGMASQYGNLGLIYMTRGDLDQAEAMHKKSLAINEKLGRLEGMANNYAALGLVLRARGDLGQAEQMHAKSLELEQKLERLEGIAREHSNLGLIYKQRGDLDTARKYWTKARDLYTRIGIPHMLDKVQGWLDELPPPSP